MLATAKIHILKQFTTGTFLTSVDPSLCLLLQRYTFWSNSQPLYHTLVNVLHCACYCKDTHFEAIHNAGAGSPGAAGIVLATAKIHILKQFTTQAKRVLFPLQLCLLLQRYTFWSNSQRHRRNSFYSGYCACYCKDTHFEAIHNSPRAATTATEIVLATAKRHILKQFTTQLIEEIASVYCACYCKDTHFEAIHNLP